MDVAYSECGFYYLMEISTQVNLYNIIEFKKLLFDLISSPHKNVAVTLTENTHFMDSSVINALISAKKKKSALQGNFAIVNIDESVEQIFELAGLHDYFKIFKNAEELANAFD
jgi:anti-anti-sigma factor